MKVFVTGGTGFVGGHVIDELHRQGHDVRALVHRRRPSAFGGVEQVEGDVMCPESFEGAMTGCEAVVHLVGIIREFPSRGITFERMHVRATGNVLAAAAQARVGRFLHMSALGTRQGAVSAYHGTKYRAEELVRASGLCYTIFRPSLIFGPKDGFVNMLAGQLRYTPVMPVIGTGAYRLQPIHAGDVARCFALALGLPETVGGCYELCGDRRLTYVELLDEIAAAMGRPAPFKPRVPLAPMRLLISLLQGFPLFPITRDQLQMLIEESICSGRWKEVFGFEPKDFTAGIREYIS